MFRRLKPEDDTLKSKSIFFFSSVRKPKGKTDLETANILGYSSRFGINLGRWMRTFAYQNLNFTSNSMWTIFVDWKCVTEYGRNVNEVSLDTNILDQFFF